MHAMGFDTFNVGPELEYFYFRDSKSTEVLDEGGYFDLTTLDAGSDLRRETVLALVVLKPQVTVSEEDLLAWCREAMATYKAPRLIRFVEQLPKSGTGKILWRELQAQEHERVGVLSNPTR